MSNDLNGKKNHINDDTSNATNQKNALAIKIMILIGSFKIVMTNIARGGP